MTARAIGLLLSLGIVSVLAFAGSTAQPAPTREEPRASPGEGGLVFPLDRTSVPGPLSPSPGYNDTSEFMAGSVAVAVFLVESNGAAYDWSDSEVNQTLDGIYAGLSWWASQERKARLAFSYELHVRPPTAWEPIQNPLSDDWIWIDGILADFGYTDADPWAKALRFANDLRQRLRTDWGYSIFVADSDAAVNLGRFTDNQYAHGYYGGPWLTMSRYSSWAYNSADYFRVVPAHETGHIFYATDEYDSNPVEYSGYLNCPDSNGASGIMNRNTLGVSASTRCQVGWVDADGGGVLDILDVPPETTLSAHTPNPTNETRVAYLGNATVVPLPNRNPQGPRNDVTIGRILGVDFRLDGGAWQTAEAVDGSFDGAQEAYHFTAGFPVASHVDVLPAYVPRRMFNVTATVAGQTGSHAIEASSRNTEQNIDSTPAVDRLDLAGELTATVELLYHRGGDPIVPWARFEVDEDPPWSWSVNTSETGGDGPYEFYSLAEGVAGTSESKTPRAEMATIADATAPVFISTAPSGVLTASEVVVSWNATDATSGIARYEVSVDGTPFASVDRETHLPLVVSDGDHVVLVRAVDEAGNAIVAEIRFRVDTNILSPTGPFKGVPLYVLMAAALASIVAVAVIVWRRRRADRAARGPEERKP